MKSSVSLLLSVVAVCSLGSLSSARAQDAFFTDETQPTAINYAVNGSAYVGYGDLTDYLIQNDPTSPTVELITGGDISQSVYVSNSSIFNVSGGSIGLAAVAYDDSTINISGGSIGAIAAVDDSTINLFGTGLSSTLVDANFFGFYSRYALAGTLTDGTSVNGESLFVENDTDAHFTINAVPEASSLVLFGVLSVGGIGLFARRRVRSV